MALSSKVLNLVGLSKLNLLKGITNCGVLSIPNGAKALSTSCICRFPWEERRPPRNWPSYNKKVFDPLPIEEPQRPAYYCHMKLNVKYSTLKLWYVACLVRGMSIDEALRQVDFVKKKGASFVKETLLEAQELAVQTQNVEFRSNLWVAESFTGKGIVVKGIRRHARKHIGIIHYRHSNYFVRLEEGSPPKDYYPPEPDGPTLLQRWIQEQRNQRVVVSI